MQTHSGSTPETCPRRDLAPRTRQRRREKVRQKQDKPQMQNHATLFQAQAAKKRFAAALCKALQPSAQVTIKPAARAPNCWPCLLQKVPAWKQVTCFQSCSIIDIKTSTSGMCTAQMQGNRTLRLVPPRAADVFFCPTCTATLFGPVFAS